jgi:hypothetical protein
MHRPGNILTWRIQGIVNIIGLRKACVEDIWISILYTLYNIVHVGLACTCI